VLLEAVQVCPESQLDVPHWQLEPIVFPSLSLKPVKGSVASGQDKYSQVLEVAVQAWPEKQLDVPH